MFLQKLTLSGIGVHPKLEVDFKSGVNGIIGPMASGKTTILQSIEFLLTGDWPGSGTKEKVISWGYDKGEGELQFLANDGTPCVIRRSLHSSSVSFKIGKEKTLTGAAKVQEQLAKILVCPKEVLQTYCFVRQGRVTDVLLSKPSVRKDMFNILFGTSYVDTLSQELAEELNKVVPVSLAIDRPVIEKQLVDNQKSQVELNKQLLSLQEQIAKIDEVGLRSFIEDQQRQSDRYRHATEGYDATVKSITTLTTQLDGGSKQRDQIAAQRQQLDVALSEFQKDLDVAKQQLSQQAQIQQQIEQRRRLVEQAAQAQQRYAEVLQKHDTLKQQLQARPEPAVEPDKDNVLLLWETGELMPKENKVRQLEEFIRGFTSPPPGTPACCSTCGTTAIVDSAGGRVDVTMKLQSCYAELQQLKPIAQQERGEYEAYKARRQQTTHNHAVWQAWRAGVDVQLANLASSVQQHIQQVDERNQMLNATPEPVRLDTAAAEQMVQQFTAGQEQQKALQKGLGEWDTYLATLQTQLSMAQARLQQHKNLVLAPENQILTVRQQLAQLDSLKLNAAGLTGQLTQLNVAITEGERRVRELAELENRTAAIAEYRKNISELRGVFHRDNYPAGVARRRFHMLNSSWNAMLRDLDVRFSVKVEDDATIMCHWPKGSAMIDKCSGGEGCCAAISFMLTVNRQFAAQTGFLVLDEPTYGVDEEHMPRLRDLLLRVQEYATNAGIQILVVTHEQRLRTGFNHVIELAAAA